MVAKPELLADPSLFAAELRTLDRGRWVVVDEVQRDRFLDELASDTLWP